MMPIWLWYSERIFVTGRRTAMDFKGESYISKIGSVGDCRIAHPALA